MALITAQAAVFSPKVESSARTLTQALSAEIESAVLQTVASWISSSETLASFSTWSTVYVVRQMKLDRKLIDDFIGQTLTFLASAVAVCDHHPPEVKWQLNAPSTKAAYL